MESARLNSDERFIYRGLHQKRCEITGDYVGNVGEIHHAKPISHYGTKNLDNLVYLSRDVHARIHMVARRRARTTGGDLGEITEKLTKDAMALGKLGRTLEGENPQHVYQREANIDRFPEWFEPRDVKRTEADLIKEDSFNEQVQAFLES